MLGTQRAYCLGVEIGFKGCFVLALMTLAPACVAEQGEDSPDGQYERAFARGQADAYYDDCKQEDIVNYINDVASFTDMVDDGIHVNAALSIANMRSGADGVLGTRDDVYIDDLDALDNLDYVGPIAMDQISAAAPRVCGVAVPEAYDVDRQRISLGTIGDITYYTEPYAKDFYMEGTEFWQRWPGGESPIYDFEDGTDEGRKCMQLSAIRFNAIMENPPKELIELKELSFWDGGFFNRNDDYSRSQQFTEPGARLWAWRTSVIKWISQTDNHDSCFLPTWDLVRDAAIDCLEVSRDRRGEIEGCSLSFSTPDGPI